MLSPNRQFTNRISPIAQVETEGGNSSDASSASPTGISLLDNTRLGPYSSLLKDAFEQSQSEQVLQLNEPTSEVDMVAIARSLTAEEKSQGLDQQLVTREKIALIVDTNNPFSGTLTLQQVAKIFRGEITNWKQVGGEDRPLKLVHRPAQNMTRQALEDYGLFNDTTFKAAGVDPQQDTTAGVRELLGTDGLSYAPASETIEQFNTRVITIDNVGVNDGRYPFSQPLHYVYKANPKLEVQGFLDFLTTPDAQAAIEFAQSQPADPTRVSRSSALSALSAQSPDASDSPPSETDAIPATPLDPPATSTLESPLPEPGTEPAVGSGGSSWIPIALIFLVLGLLGWLVYMRTRLDHKRESSPRPAPDYAARLKAQGSNRDKEELEAIATGPIKAQSSIQTLNTPDLTLGMSASTQPEASEPERQTDQNVNTDEWSENIPFWEEDQTELQSASAFPNPDQDNFDDIEEDVTILQNDAPNASAGLSQDALSSEESEDMTLLQDIFAPGEPDSDRAADDELDEDITLLQGANYPDEPQRDSLTGQLTEELEALSELSEAEEGGSPDSKSTDKASSKSSNRDGDIWDELSDPWD